MNENGDNNNNNSLLPPTPLRNSCQYLIQNLEMTETSPSINTPKGTKIYHPFLSDTIINLDKQFTSPDMFNKNREYPHTDSHTLSPDLVGTLFPKDINTNVEIQHQFEESLYKKYQSYFDLKSAKFFTDNIFKPSPEPHDSGIGISLQCTEPSSTNSDNTFATPASMLMCQTPPSKFKWNRAEYRTTKNSNNNRSSLGCPEMSLEDLDDQYNQIINQENLESTQLDDIKCYLADNWSMRQQSAIGSPMFYDDRVPSSFIEQSPYMKHFIRSSPHTKFNPSVMNGIDLSPIKRTMDDDMDTDQDLA